MKLEQQISIPASIEEVWSFLTDIPQVGQCIPGVEGLELQGDSYAGRMKVKVGPISLAFEGLLNVQAMELESKMSSFTVEAMDRRVGGGLRAKVVVKLESKGEKQTNLSVETEATLIGKLAQFGQPIIRRKADAILKAMAENIGKKVSAG